MLLALDTATPMLTVAVHDGQQVRARRNQVDARRHAELLAPLVRQVLDEAGVPGPSLSSIVVGVGPGAYTGLRVGLVTARTLGLVWQVPVHGVCSLDALAVQAVHDGAPSELLVVTDARRGQVFWARYVDARRVQGPAVDVAAAVPRADLPAVGAGAVAHAEVFGAVWAPEHPGAVWAPEHQGAVWAPEHQGAVWAPEHQGAVWAPEHPDAGWLAAGVQQGLSMLLPVEPLYLRRPDVTPSGGAKPVLQPRPSA